MNIASDFNQEFQQYDEQSGTEDTHLSGQPSLLYRGEIAAAVGERIAPEPYGQTAPDTLRGEMAQTLDGITTAGEIFKSIEIRVVRPPIKLF